MPPLACRNGISSMRGGGKTLKMLPSFLVQHLFFTYSVSIPGNLSISHLWFSLLQLKVKLNTENVWHWVCLVPTKGFLPRTSLLIGHFSRKAHARFCTKLLLRNFFIHDTQIFVVMITRLNVLKLRTVELKWAIALCLYGEVNPKDGLFRV